MRIIHSCRSKEEFLRKIMLLNIWRVELKEDKREDEVAGDEFCGYVSMAHIINKSNIKLRMNNRKDRDSYKKFNK